MLRLVDVHYRYPLDLVTPKETEEVDPWSEPQIRKADFSYCVLGLQFLNGDQWGSDPLLI